MCGSCSFNIGWKLVQFQHLSKFAPPPKGGFNHEIYRVKINVSGTLEEHKYNSSAEEETVSEGL